MTTLVNGLLKAIDCVETVVSDALGLRPYRVYLREKPWVPGIGAAEVGRGALSETDVEILPRPNVKETEAMGLFVGPVQPAYTVGAVTGGYGPLTLNPAPVQGTDRVFAVVGPDGITREYKLTDIKTEDPLAYFLTLAPLDHAGAY